MLRNLKLVFSTNILFLAFSVVTSLLSAWALGAEGRGELAIITMWLFIFTLAGTLGLPYAHRYWAARKPEWNSQIFSNTIIYTMIASVFVFIAGWVLIPYIISEQKSEIIFLTQLFLVNVPIIFLNELFRGQLEGAKLFGWMGIARLSFISSQAVSYVILYTFGLLSLQNALIVVVFGQILAASVMFTGIRRELKPKWIPDFKIFAKEINYGVRSYFGIVTEFAVWRLDQVMLTALVSSTTVGLYAVAVAIAEITATLASSVSDALLPELAASDNRTEAILLLGKSLRLTLYAQLLTLIPFWIAAPYMLHYVFGAEFVAATGALRLLFIASIIWSAGLILISGLNGFGNPGLSTIARVSSAVTTIILLVIFLPERGMIGAAIASIAGYSVMLIVALICLLRTQKITLWELLKPRRDDISITRLKTMIHFPSAQPSKI